MGGGGGGRATGTDLQELVEEEGEPVGQHLLGHGLRPDRKEVRSEKRVGRWVII